MSSSALEKARTAHSRVLRAMERNGTARNIAQILGTSDTTVSRTKGQLEDVMVLIYHLGFKVVPQDCEMVPGDYLQALRVMARAHIAPASSTLDWEGT